MPTKLLKHGTNAGYRAEIATRDNACNRCANAHRVYQRQFSKAYKAKGIRYSGDQVIDHLYGKGAEAKPPRAALRAEPQASSADEDLGDYTIRAEPSPEGRSAGRTGPSLSDRIRNLVIPTSEESQDNSYVDSADVPDYLHPIDPDPEPSGEEWSSVADINDEEFIINAAGMKKIEENLGTYLSIVGMTAEMIDPYCGRVLSDNFDNIIKKWTKVIAHYPKAANLFLDGKGGIVFAWIAALQATWPLLFAIYEHHLSKTVKTEGGAILRRMPVGFRPDATMPPMPDDFSYSAS